MTAALFLAEAGFDVTILERQDRIGKKILQTGNGRCNISNKNISVSNYVSQDPDMLKEILASFDTAKEQAFLQSLGIALCERDGCLYPVSRQASSVLDSYRFRLQEKKIRILTDTKVVRLKQKASGYEVIAETKEGRVGYGDFSYCILSCGGMAGVYREAENNGYGITREMGHGMTLVHPALTPLKCEGDFKAAAGIRADAECKLIVRGKTHAKSRGEVQFTESGLSGIPIFQLSLYITEKDFKDTKIELDLLGFLGKEKEAYDIFTARVNAMSGRTLEEFFAGWLQKKLAIFLIRRTGLKPSALVREINAADVRKLYENARSFNVHVTKTGEWKNAQIQCGGIPLSELNVDLGSKKMQGVYLTGEMLDVAGMCGGYNLHFALASAYVCASAIIKKSGSGKYKKDYGNGGKEDISSGT